MALNGKYLQDADKLLAEGDFVQASEKYWGAAAEIVKAIAQNRGWRHNSHYDLRQAIASLHEETDDPDIPRLFGLMETLHSNFYENWMRPEQVRLHAEDAHRLVEKLRPLVA